VWQFFKRERDGGRPIIEARRARVEHKVYYIIITLHNYLLGLSLRASHQAN